MLGLRRKNVDTLIWSIGQFEELLREFIRDSLPSGIGIYRAKFEFSLDSGVIAEYLASNNDLIIKTQNEKEITNVVDSLDRSGLASIDSTLMLPSSPQQFPHKQVEDYDWADWFIQFTNLHDGLIVDTNMLMRHYCSNLLFEKLGNRFDSLKIKIPRLAILEIERNANTDKERDSVKKRLGLFATSEIIFLKNHKAELLPTLPSTLFTSFSEKAGDKTVDSWIRKEIHDYITRPQSDAIFKPLFATCDIANGLAAYSEELSTCVFSRIPEEKLSITTSFKDASNLAMFILNLAVTCGKIKMNVYGDGQALSNTYFVEGMWSGKTPYDWTNGCLRTQEIK